MENLLAYKLPDYSLLQEFIWQVVDNPRYMPRILRFLEYWKTHLEGPIVKVEVSESPLGFGKYESSCHYRTFMT